MEKIKNNKYFVGIMVVSTLVLAGIATFTAYRLYQLRDRVIAPNVPQGEVYAFSCEEYEMLIDTDGTIRISNVSGESQPSQEIEIIVGGQSLGSFTIPALDPETNTEIGGINLPAGDFNWNIEGDILCQGNQTGTLHETENCNIFSVNLASAQTLPSSTPTPTPTTPSNTTPTPTPTLTTPPSNTPTPTTTENGPTATPTPTTNEISETTELMDSGSSSKTLLLLITALFSIVGTAQLVSRNLNQN